jgi:hypothetical protein
MQVTMIKRVLTCLALAGCSQPIVPAMHPAGAAPLSRPAAPGEASVVFVRPPSSCDTIEYPKIVDENGHFVGNAGPNTSFVVTVPAGRRAFYAWPNVDPRTAKYPTNHAVGAVLVDAPAGSVGHVAILIPKGPSLRCFSGTPPYGLVAYDESDAARAEFESWRRDATPMEPETEAGERDLERNPGLVCANIEAGRRGLPVPLPATCGLAPVASGAGR